MRMKVGRVGGAVVAAVLMVSIAGCTTGAPEGGSSPSDTPSALPQNEELTKILTAAKSEAGLTIAWPVINDDASNALAAAFKKEYGLTVPVSIVFRSDQDALTAKLVEESTAGIPATSDVFLATASQASRVGATGQGFIAPLDWASFAPWTKGLESEKGDFLAVTNQFAGFIYNTNKIKESELPKTAQDVIPLAKTKKIASTPYASGFSLLGYFWPKDKVFQYVTDFTPAGLIACGEVSRVASGEFDGMWIACGNSYVDQGVKEGAPLGFHMVSDVSFMNTSYIGVPKNSAHPNLAKLFAAWMNSPQAQAILRDKASMDNAFVPGTDGAKFLAKLKSQGINPVVSDLKFDQEHPDLNDRAYKAEIVKRLTQK